MEVGMLMSSKDTSNSTGDVLFKCLPAEYKDMSKQERCHEGESLFELSNGIEKNPQNMKEEKNKKLIDTAMKKDKTNLTEEEKNAVQSTDEYNEKK
uniref:Thymosin beta n=1 Tax=Rhabditophanes sp. KR3021 TaxID=114890 RepID=A0AC35UGK4_9BILA